MILKKNSHKFFNYVIVIVLCDYRFHFNYYNYTAERFKERIKKLL